MLEQSRLISKILSNKFFIIFINIVFITSGVGLSYFGYSSIVLSAQESLLCPNFPEEKQANLGKIYADISGSIINPGVYQLDYGSRLTDLVNMAGGFTKTADSVYLAQSINLAKEISDADKFYIPSEGENSTSPPTPLQQVERGVTSNLNNPGLTSINTASNNSLQELPGIGEKRAEDIINNRPYSSLEELMSKEVLTQTLFDEVKTLIEL